MDKNIRITPTRNVKDSTTFGGIIRLSDYYTNFLCRPAKRSRVASRIKNDEKFDIYCKRNIAYRSKEKEFKNGSDF